MSEPIKVGDLVMVVRACCEPLYREIVGVPWEVAELRYIKWRCHLCGTNGAGLSAVSEQPYAHGSKVHTKSPLPWLKRIPPLSELDDVKQDEELTV